MQNGSMVCKMAGMQNNGPAPKTAPSVITFHSEQVVMNLRRLLRIVGFLLLASVVSLHSQTTPSDSGNAVATIKTKVRLVLVDVVVTNGKGEAVSGLHKD